MGSSWGERDRGNGRIRVFLADDHDVVIRGISSILEEQPDMVIVHSVKTGRGLLEKIRAVSPDVVLLDIRMPDFSLYQFLPQAQALEPAPHILIISAMADYYLAARAEELGVAGYLLKEDALSDDLPIAIRAVANGEFRLSTRVRSTLSSNLRRCSYTALSEEQYRILRMMVNGYTVQEIAGLVSKSVSAVYSAQQRIREKLNVETTEQAIIKAIRERLVEIDNDEGRL